MNENLWDIYKNVKDSMNEEEDAKHSDGIQEKGDILLCYNCSQDTLINDDGIIVCENCGVDNGQIIDLQQEARYYGIEDTRHATDPTRCGMPLNPLLPNSSFGTIILGGRGYNKIRQLNSWNSMTHKERSLLKVFKHIQSKSVDEDIEICIIDRSKIMYKTLSEETIKRGKCRKGLIAACVYNSCKDKNDIRSTREISKMFGIKIKKMTSGCKEFDEIMHYSDNEYKTKKKPISANNFIERYSSILKMDQKDKDRTKYIADMAYKLGIVLENIPSSVAVGSIYLASQYYGLGVSKKRLSEICGISEVTITKSYKKMYKFRKYLVPLEEEEN